MKTQHRLLLLALAGPTITACGGGDDAPAVAPLPQLSAATGANRTACTELASAFTFAGTRITAASVVATNTLQVAGKAVPEHCLVTGVMNERTGVNGAYRIGFEMRLPTAWNGRFFHQANGGADGAVVTAVGPQSGGGGLTHALHMGFAVLSSDAGHNGAQNNTGPTHFGFDPQARIDYGYQAVGTLTPMARALVQRAYGKAPDRMYLGGCSNGGRHAMVAAARYGAQYDGLLAGNPGFNLPRSAVGGMWDVQQFASIATPGSTSAATGGLLDLSTGFTAAERSAVAARILKRCDALDGASDGMVLNVAACQQAFSLANVPDCGSGGRTGSCLTPLQKGAIGRVYAGARNSAGTALYTGFPWDPGVAGANWALWKYVLKMTLSAPSVAQLFTVPPQVPANPLDYALGFSMDGDAPKVAATNATFTESPVSFATPPTSDLATLRDRGAKLLIYHGTADPTFSSDDTARWYDELRRANGGDASRFARYFEVPGMNHCSGGPATDQFDMITALVEWVEQGRAPDQVVASVRGAGNAGGVNTELPAGWSATRTRPLCPYPQTAQRRDGATDLESAASFVCR
jgi:feruloyl esterase